MEDMLTCTSCGRIFEVVWNNDGLGPPEYCPMCGAEIDYLKCMEEEENDM
jgi:rRNA maturation endonuclease Nob1